MRIASMAELRLTNLPRVSGVQISHLLILQSLQTVGHCFNICDVLPKWTLPTHSTLVACLHLA